MNDGKRIIQDKRSQAYRFHEKAFGFLSSLGFELDNDPTVVISRYHSTRARYRSGKGLYISVYFDPADTNSAGIKCGRRWRDLKMDFWGDPYRLSGNYSMLAKRCDLDIRSTFRLGHGEEIPQTMNKILQILKETLPVIMEKTSLQDLISIEKEKYGVQEWAINFFGDDYEDCVEISLYDRK